MVSKQWRYTPTVESSKSYCKNRVLGVIRIADVDKQILVKLINDNKDSADLSLGTLPTDDYIVIINRCQIK